MKLSERTKKWGLISLLWLAGLIAYSNIFENQFLLDDEFLLQKNALIKSWGHFFDLFTVSSTGGAGGADSFYRPIQTLAYLIFNQLFGFSPATFHALSLLLHLLNASFVALLGFRLGFHRLAVFASALLWVVHPIHTESVTYMSAIADSLHTLFILMGMWFLAKDVSLKRICLSIPFFLLALLSKEAGIVFPAMVIALIYFRSPKTFSLPQYLITWPLWVVALLYLVARKTILNFDESFSFYKQSNIYTENILYRLYTFFATIPNYLELLVWPQDLHLERSFPVHVFWALEVWIGFFVLAFALAVLWIERNKVPRIASFGILWALASHVPGSGVLIPVNAFFLEHWMYLVSIGPFLAIPQIFARSFKVVWIQRLAFVAALVMAGALGAATWNQNFRWADAITFYEYVISVEPKPPARLFNNLAMAYSDKGKFDLAEKYYRLAILASDHHPQTHHNLGILLVNSGRVDEAIKHFDRALELDPNFYHSMGALAEIYKFRKDTEKEAYYRKSFWETRAKFSF